MRQAGKALCVHARHWRQTGFLTTAVPTRQSRLACTSQPVHQGRGQHHHQQCVWILLLPPLLRAAPSHPSDPGAAGARGPAEGLVMGSCGGQRQSSDAC